MKSVKFYSYLLILARYEAVCHDVLQIIDRDDDILVLCWDVECNRLSLEYPDKFCAADGKINWICRLKINSDSFLWREDHHSTAVLPEGKKIISDLYLKEILKLKLETIAFVGVKLKFLKYDNTINTKSVIIPSDLNFFNILTTVKTLNRLSYDCYHMTRIISNELIWIQYIYQYLVLTFPNIFQSEDNILWKIIKYKWLIVLKQLMFTFPQQ
jgi:hypothetical protein